MHASTPPSTSTCGNRLATHIHSSRLHLRVFLITCTSSEIPQIIVTIYFPIQNLLLYPHSCTLLTLPLLTKLARTRGPLIPARYTQHRAASMAWRSHGTNNDSLVNNLKKNGLIESDRVKEAMMKVLPSTHAHIYQPSCKRH